MQPQSTKPSPTDLAWAAGYFDREGSISVTYARARGNISHRFHLTIMSTQIESLEAMKAVFGGTIHPAQPRGNRKPCHIWIVYGEEAQRAVVLMRPYLKLKCEQARWALLFPLRGRGKGSIPERIGQQREMVRTALTILNSRGKITPQALPLI